MSDGVRIRALGVDIVLGTERAAVRDFIERDWARCVVRGAEASADAGLQLEIALDELPDPSLGYDLTTSVTRQAIEASVGRLLMFHAAGLSDEAGRVLMLVAPSGTGKTTAAAELARAGAGYVTDETVGITADLEVVPYPKPLAVRDGPGRKAQRSPDDLGLRGCPESLRIHRVVLLDRNRSDHVAPVLDRLGLLDGLLELIPQTSSLFALDRPIQRLCELSAACGGIYRLSYSDIRDAVDLLATLGDEDTAPGGGRPSEPWAPLDHLSVTAPAAPAIDLFRRAPFLDAVEVGGEGLVLLDSVPVRLGPLALTLWRAADGSANQDALLAAAVREHGPHSDAEALVQGVLVRLLETGVVATDSREAARLLP